MYPFIIHYSLIQLFVKEIVMAFTNDATIDLYENYFNSLTTVKKIFIAKNGDKADVSNLIPVETVQPDFVPKILVFELLRDKRY